MIKKTYYIILCEGMYTQYFFKKKENAEKFILVLKEKYKDMYFEADEFTFEDEPVTDCRQLEEK